MGTVDTVGTVGTVDRGGRLDTVWEGNHQCSRCTTRRFLHTVVRSSSSSSSSSSNNPCTRTLRSTRCNTPHTQLHRGGSSIIAGEGGTAPSSPTYNVFVNIRTS